MTSPAATSIADLLEATNRELAGTDARLYRRMGDHLRRTAGALRELNREDHPPAPEALALLGRGSFRQQTLTTLRQLCRERGIRGFSRLNKAGLAELLERHGVEPPPRPLESFSKKELIGILRQLLGRR